jgi:hypothetical protein
LLAPRTVGGGSWATDLGPTGGCYMEDRAARARDRGQQIARRLLELKAGNPVTQSDVDLASQRASSALLHSAVAHERTAVLHDQAADRHGDPDDGHQDAATTHRDAGDEDLRLAFDG